MKPAAFDYHRPPTLDEALKALSADDAVPIAGGQSLLPLLGLRMSTAGRLIDIGRIEGMRRVEDKGTHVVIGAGVTHAEIEDGLVPDPGRGLMQRMAGRIAYRAIRNHGTIGGSVAMADPSADWPVCLMALGAVAIVAGADGERRVAVSDLVEDTYTTTLAPGELILAFEVPWLAPVARTGVEKVARKTGAFAMSQAVVVLNDGAKAPRVFLAGAAGRALRLTATSALLARDATEADLRAAIAEDLAATAAAEDAYAMRLHTAVTLRSIAEARGR